MELWVPDPVLKAGPIPFSSVHMPTSKATNVHRKGKSVKLPASETEGVPCVMLVPWGEAMLPSPSPPPPSSPRVAAACQGPAGRREILPPVGDNLDPGVGCADEAGGRNPVGISLHPGVPQERSRPKLQRYR